MMKIRALFFAIFCACFIVACSKTSPLLENNKDFIGVWKNETGTISIEKNGDARYSSHEKLENMTKDSDEKVSESSEIKAQITEFDSSHFRIGSGGFGKSFVINKAPYQDNGKWKVVLNDEEYVKK
ncbi:hypothetical protein [Acinetobacter gerneri]|nr:hypothetical protein [Acinetobacter gerneri]